MPLRDQFRPPVSRIASWEGFYGGLPAMIVQSMNATLPEQYVAEPRVQLGPYIDALESREEAGEQSPSGTGPTKQYKYEVLVFDLIRSPRLVAAIELVSPGNKCRPDVRRHFVKKCVSMLQEGVCVSIVDLVTTRNFNLYTDLLALIDRSDPAFSPTPPPVYAVTIRPRKAEPHAKLDLWAYPLAVGQPLPQLPIWLSEDQRVMLDLEASYEDACRALRIA